MLVKSNFSTAKIRIAGSSSITPVVHQWVVVVTKKDQPQVEVAHLLVTSVEQITEWLSTITISYRVLHGPEKGTGSFSGCVEPQAHTHPKASLSHETPSSGGFITVTPDRLQGNGIGTYMQALVVAFVKGFPDAIVQPVRLSDQQAEGANTARRYRFYKAFGLNFYNETVNMVSGRSIPMPASDLLEPVSWRETIKEMTIAEYAEEIHSKSSALTRRVENLTQRLANTQEQLGKAKKSPLSWGVKTFFWKHTSIFGALFCAALAAVCLMAFVAG
nr:hypothetical protein [uncultured Pseudomonas sp.]